VLDDKIQKDNLKEDKKYEKNWWGNKVIDLNSNISVITLHINRINTLIKNKNYQSIFFNDATTVDP